MKPFGLAGGAVGSKAAFHEWDWPVRTKSHIAEGRQVIFSKFQVCVNQILRANASSIDAVSMRGSTGQMETNWGACGIRCTRCHLAIESEGHRKDKQKFKQRKFLHGLISFALE